MNDHLFSGHLFDLVPPPYTLWATGCIVVSTHNAFLNHTVHFLSLITMTASLATLKVNFIFGVWWDNHL